MKNKEIANPLDPNVRRRIEAKDLGYFVVAGAWWDAGRLAGSVVDAAIELVYRRQAIHRRHPAR